MVGRQKIQEEFLESLTLLYRSILSQKHKIIKKAHLNRSQIEVLYFLHNHGRSTIKQIAEAMCVTSSSETQLVDGLVKAGFAKRTKHPTDRRSVCIELSSKGKQLLIKIKENMFTEIIPKLSQVSDQELIHITEIAKKINTVKS